MITVTSRAERARQDELRELAALMRQRGALASVPPPRPLHKMAAAPAPETSAGSPPAAASTEE